MEIRQYDRETKGFFKAEGGGKEAGRMTYSWAGKDKFVIDHTEVNPRLQWPWHGPQIGDGRRSIRT